MRKGKVTTRKDTSAKKRFAKKTTRKESKKAVKGVFNTIEYDSLEELGMLQWLFELKTQGIVKSIRRAESYLLCDGLYNNYAEQMKRVNSRPVAQNLLHGHSYTPEFEVVWDYTKARDLFVWDHLGKACKFDKLFIGRFVVNPTNQAAEFVTIIEVKPSFDQNNMERLFKLNQKWMWDKHKIFVNLVKIQELFPKSFTPKAYLTTPSGRVRILKWKPKSLYNFINNK